MSTTYPTAPKVERKVKAAAIWTYLAACAGLGIVNGISDANLVAGLPDWAEVFVAPIVPTVAAWIAGYKARHTPRPDLSPQQR